MIMKLKSRWLSRLKEFEICPLYLTQESWAAAIVYSGIIGWSDPHNPQVWPWALRPRVPFLEPFGMNPQPLGLKVDILPLSCSAISGAAYNLKHVSTQIMFVIQLFKQRKKRTVQYKTIYWLHVAVQLVD